MLSRQSAAVIFTDEKDRIMSEEIMVAGQAEENKADESSEAANTAGTVRVSAKWIDKRLKYVAKETRRGVFERKRNQVAVDVLRHIATGEAKSPRNLARAFVEAYPEQPAEKPEATEDTAA
jgi:hypothetical protein